MPKYIVKEDALFEDKYAVLNGKKDSIIVIPAGTVIELEEINGN